MDSVCLASHPTARRHSDNNNSPRAGSTGEEPLYEAHRADGLHNSRPLHQDRANNILLSLPRVLLEESGRFEDKSSLLLHPGGTPPGLWLRSSEQHEGVNGYLQVKVWKNFLRGRNLDFGKLVTASWTHNKFTVFFD